MEEIMQMEDWIYRQVFENILDGVLIVTPDLRIIKSNPIMSENFPRSMSTKGVKCHEVFQCRKSPCTDCLVNKVVRSGKPEQGVLKGPYDNEHGEYELSAYPLKNPETNEITAILQIVKDIGRYKNTEELERAMSLIEKEKQSFESFFNTLPYPMYLKDRESRFLMINQAMSEKYKLGDLQSVIGKTDFDIFTEDHAEPAYLHEQEIMQTGIAKIGYEEEETTLNNTTTYCLTTKMPVHNYEGDIIGIQGVSVDISKRKEVENQVRENLKEIKLINKKLENYSFTISHDLKEPIRSIRTFSEFIKEDYSEQFDDEANDYFNRIIKASEKMAMMIDDLLVLSRVGRVDTEFKLASIPDIIANMKDTLHQILKESDTTIITGDLPEIVCQPVWINAIFQNLITNSIKHSDKEKTRIEINYTELPAFHEFSVKDNGRGIPEDQHKKVFGLFRKAHQDRNTKGSGAGLAIVSDVVDHHHGRIYISWSELGKGTEIKFTIKKRKDHGR